MNLDRAKILEVFEAMIGVAQLKAVDSPGFTLCGGTEQIGIYIKVHPKPFVAAKVIEMVGRLESAGMGVSTFEVEMDKLVSDLRKNKQPPSQN